MRAGRHGILLIVLLVALSLLFEHAGHIRLAQTVRTIVVLAAIFWLLFLGISYDQQQLNNVLQEKCVTLLETQKRKLEESLELINLSRVQHKQPLFIPKEYQYVFYTIESLLLKTNEMSSRVSLGILRAQQLHIVHEMLLQHDKHLHLLYISERRREFERMPYRILHRLIFLRKAIPFFDARHLLPDLKRIHLLLRERHQPDFLKKKYGDNWELNFVNDVEALYSIIEEKLRIHKEPQLRRPK